MADNTENKNTSSAPDTDAALESFLSRDSGDQSPEKPQKPVKNKKLNKRVWIIIAAVVVVAALAVLLIILRGQGPEMSEEEKEKLNPAEVTLDVDSDGEHTAKVEVDENGNIKENGSGSLLNYVPSDIKQIDVENEKGSFTVTSHTPEGEATVYNLVGFEDMQLQDGIADEVATDAAALKFTKVISAGGNLADFGLDSPRAKVKVSFNDDTSAVIRVGDQAPSQAGTYIAFGSSDAVYLADDSAVDSFMYDVTRFISLAITDSAEDSENADFSSLTISGTRFDEPITLVPNTDEAVDASYIVTVPRRVYANAIESSDIAGSIRGLYGEEVVCVNPSSDQLTNYGLYEPYASVTAVYPDTEITLSASEAGSDGKVFIYNPDKNVVYTIQTGAVSWANTSVEALVPDTILSVKLDAVSNIRFSAGDKAYDIDVSTSVELKDDEEGNTQDVTVVKAVCDGKTLDENNFRVFFQNLNSIPNKGDNGSGGSEVMSFTYTYNTGRESDTVTAYDLGTAQYAIELNGEIIGSAGKSYIDSLIENPAALIKGEPVTSI